jgi:hypothetical protein
MNSSEPFYAISDRYNWDEFEEEKKKEIENGIEKISVFLYKYCFRGDCY